MEGKRVDEQGSTNDDEQESNALLSRLRLIEDQVLDQRASAFAKIHDELQASLEGGDAPARHACQAFRRWRAYRASPPRAARQRAQIGDCFPRLPLPIDNRPATLERGLRAETTLS